MTTPADMLASADWLPINYDAAGDRVLFCEIGREKRRELTFLANHQPGPGSPAVWLTGEEIRAADLQTGPIHFIFHTAFCRSTLLVKAFDMPGVAMGYSEPGILNDLADALAKQGSGAEKMVGPIIDLLARPMAPGEAVIVKPSNIANRIMPYVMQARSGTHALMLYGALPKFLGSVAKKGMEGRVWSRRLYLHNADYIALDIGLDARKMYELTDLQVTGLAWLLHQLHFLTMLNRPEFASRLATIEADAFNDNRAETILAAGRLFGLDIEETAAQDVAGGALFATHAKLGTDFAQTIAEEEEAAASAVTDHEIGLVDKWIGQIARMTGAQVPAAKPLLAG